MPVDNDRIIHILNDNPIEGVDYAEALNRFGNQAAIYLRIIGIFIESTPDTLEVLAKVRPETMTDYTIRIHGFKGSCYGISALALGDEAKALELASKDLDWDRIEQGNPLVIEHALALVGQLKHLVDMVEQEGAEGSGDIRPLLDAPDKAVLETLLEATENFDVDGIEQAIKELDKARYDSDPTLVSDLKGLLARFKYDLIRARVTKGKAD